MKQEGGRLLLASRSQEKEQPRGIDEEWERPRGRLHSAGCKAPTGIIRRNTLCSFEYLLGLCIYTTKTFFPFFLSRWITSFPLFESFFFLSLWVFFYYHYYLLYSVAFFCCFIFPLIWVVVVVEIGASVSKQLMKQQLAPYKSTVNSAHRTVVAVDKYISDLSVTVMQQQSLVTLSYAFQRLSLILHLTRARNRLVFKQL